jgi:hypothetical protein
MTIRGYERVYVPHGTHSPLTPHIGSNNANILSVKNKSSDSAKIREGIRPQHGLQDAKNF